MDAPSFSDSEINEAVAKKLGWKKFDEHYQYWIPPDLAARDKYGDRPSHLPLYSQQIQAAWEVVEKCEYFCLVKPLNNEKWKCDMGAKNDIIVIWADTAPMAICLAFLKLP